METLGFKKEEGCAGFMIGQSKKNQRNRGSRTRVNVVFISPISQKLMPTSPTMQLDHRQLIFFYCKQTLSFDSTQFSCFQALPRYSLKSLIFLSDCLCYFTVESLYFVSPNVSRGTNLFHTSVNFMRL